jgi:Cdc6-like AAA superfamily ATPase
LLPTGETALFLLAGDDMKQRFIYYPLFDTDHFLVRSKVLKLESVGSNEPFMNGRLSLSEDYARYFVAGSFLKPEFSEAFPARLVTTEMEWADAVYAPHTLEGIIEIKDWIQHGQTVLHDMGLGKRLRPGYKSLFYGPPGTGKTLTASLLGKDTGRDVYKIDLSMVVSKYIGETEKNLARVFDQAETKDWILFFDEADALFGKRTEIINSHDRFANQEVAYLLQRIEEHKGVVILASNLKENIDKAFTRRFQSIIHFPIPGVDERYNIWKQSFSEKLPPAKDVDLRKIAEKFVVSGGLMMNVIRNCSLKAVKNKQKSIPLADIENGIRRELLKEGIIFS